MVEISGRRPPTGDAGSESNELGQLVDELLDDWDSLERGVIPSSGNADEAGNGNGNGQSRAASRASRAPVLPPREPLDVESWRDLDGFARDKTVEPAEISRIVAGIDEELPAPIGLERPIEVAGLDLAEPPVRDEPRVTQVDDFVVDLDADWQSGGSNTTISPSVTDAGLEQELQHQDPDARFDHGRRSRAGVTTFAVAIAAIAAVVLALFVLRGAIGEGDIKRVDASKSVSIDLDPVTIGPGIDVNTTWSLTGVEGKTFKAVLTFHNTSDATVRAKFTEVIPKSLARGVESVVFTGPQPRVVERDPVVEYVVDVPAQSDVAVGYETRVVADGLEQSRLEEWKADLERLKTKRSGSVETPEGPVPVFPTVATDPPVVASAGGGGGGGGGKGSSGSRPPRGSRDEPGPTAGGGTPGPEPTFPSGITIPPPASDTTPPSSDPTTTTKKPTTTTKAPPQTTTPPTTVAPTTTPTTDAPTTTTAT